MYDSIGIETIPIPFGQKFPPPPEWQTKPVDELWQGKHGHYNIGIRLGKVADFESDDLVSESILAQKFENWGVNAPTCRSKRGKHRFVKVKNAPNVSFTNWNFGKGEARLRDCYSIIPSSEVSDFRYVWEGDFIYGFQNIPELDWKDIEKLVSFTEKPKAQHIIPPKYLKFSPEEWIFKTLSELRTHPKGMILHVDRHTWSSRSEAEFAIVLRLDTCGYNFDEIYRLFKETQPGHFIESHETYLSEIYNTVQNLLERPKLTFLYSGLSVDTSREKTLQILLAIAYQLNTLNFYCSYEALSSYMGLSQKMTAYRACQRLEEEGLIKIKKGQQRIKNQHAIATMFDISPYVTQ